MLAATQRPVAAAAFSDVSGPPAWKSLPSWAVVATGDKAAGSDIVRSMAQRAGADIVEVDNRLPPADVIPEEDSVPSGFLCLAGQPGDERGVGQRIEDRHEES